MRTPEQVTYLKARQVAELLAVSAKTVTAWAKKGKLPCLRTLRTLGGQRRYPEPEILALAEELTSDTPGRA
jgi:excisionase family DNA binding protein